MNEIDILYQNAEELPEGWHYEAFVNRLMAELHLEGYEVSLVFSDEPFMAELNRTYMGKEGPTDVLSFPQEDDMTGEERPLLAGDIVLCRPYIRANSESLGISEEEETKRLTIHGLLHLLGETHSSYDPAEPMLVRQEKLLNQLKDQLS